MIRRPPRSTRTDTLFPYTTLFRSDAGRQPKIGIVGDRQRFVIVLDPNNGGDRPENLLAIDPHRIVGFGEQRGRHIEAWGVAVQQITASLVRAFAHAHIEVALIAVDLSLIDHRADLRARLERLINQDRKRTRLHSSPTFASR